MNTTIVIQNGKCITLSGVIEDGIVAFEDGKIIYVGQKARYSIPSDAKVIDAAGKFISPGFIDIQINGGGGSDTLDGTNDAYNQIAGFHSRHGVTNMLLTLVSASIEKSVEVLKSIRSYSQGGGLGKIILGAHVEGPYISPAQLGAHNPRFILTPVQKDYKRFYDYLDVIKIVTQAPEIPGVLEFCSELVRKGVVASIGHSDANFEEVMKAIDSGFEMVTHIYSVMSTVKREGLDKVAGVVEAALLTEKLWVEVINDGQHVPEPLFKLVLKNKGVNKIILSSDAIRAAGLEDGKYTLGDLHDNHHILVEEGIAMTIDRKLYAGSTATMNECVFNAVKFGGLEVQDAVAMATINPAKLLKLDSKIGSIEKGKSADIILFDDEINVSLVIKEGKVIYEQKASLPAGMEAAN